MANNQKFSFNVLRIIQNRYDLNLFTTYNFDLQGFQNLSLQFCSKTGSQFGDWDSLMVIVNSGWKYDQQFWICDFKCIIDDKQISLPNIKYDPKNHSKFGWVNLNELKEINFQLIKEKAQIITNGDEHLNGDEYLCDNGFFQIEFVVSDININSSIQNSIWTSYRNCMKLYEDNEFADVTLNVNGRELKAHKCMLAIRSPVFQRMFNTDMLESKTNIVNIDDISQDVFVQLLKYIYTGTADVNKYATELFLAAEKYLIDDLKEECKEIINNHISIDNCIKILVLADQVKDSLTETKAIEFINRNKDKIDVDDLFEQHPHLIFKLYKAINLNTSD